MAYQKKQYSNSRPSTGGAARKADEGQEFDSSTTHYLKNTNKEFVDNVQMWENEGQFGAYIKVRVTETLEPGDYYLSAKKGHKGKIA